MFKTLIADPAWKFNDKLPGESRGAGNNYKVLTLDDICNIQIPEMQKDSWLFLWRVSSQVEEAYRVVRAWGFVPKSEIVWLKLTKNGLPWFGMGRSVRASHETCIIATRGSPKPAVRNIRSRFEAEEPIVRVPAFDVWSDDAAPLELGTRFEAKVPVDAGNDYIHSAKPPIFHSIVEQLTGEGPRAELFARRYTPGWSCYGDQLSVLWPATDPDAQTNV